MRNWYPGFQILWVKHYQKQELNKFFIKITASDISGLTKKAVVTISIDNINRDIILKLLNGSTYSKNILNRKQKLYKMLNNTTAYFSLQTINNNTKITFSIDGNSPIKLML